MSKSAGNFFTVRDIASQFPYEVIRFFILNGHYRSPINFSRDLMEACQNGLERIKNCKKDLEYYIENCKEETAKSIENTEDIERFRNEFEEAMDDDFNTADAVTAVYELVRFINKNSKENVSKDFAEKEMDMLKTLTGILGIAENISNSENDEDVSKIEELIAKRAEAKKNKDFASADAIRDELSAMGITIKDTRQGVQWFRS